MGGDVILVPFFGSPLPDPGCKDCVDTYLDCIFGCSEINLTWYRYFVNTATNTIAATYSRTETFTRVTDPGVGNARWEFTDSDGTSSVEFVSNPGSPPCRWSYAIQPDQQPGPEEVPLGQYQVYANCGCESGCSCAPGCILIISKDTPEYVGSESIYHDLFLCDIQIGNIGFKMADASLSTDCKNNELYCTGFIGYVAICVG